MADRRTKGQLLEALAEAERTADVRKGQLSAKNGELREANAKIESLERQRNIATAERDRAILRRREAEEKVEELALAASASASARDEALRRLREFDDGTDRLRFAVFALLGPRLDYALRGDVAAEAAAALHRGDEVRLTWIPDSETAIVSRKPHGVTDLVPPWYTGPLPVPTKKAGA